MAPYEGDPSGSNEDEVRFLIGDTAASPYLSDEEIEYLLAEHVVPIRAAYHGALAIASKLTAKGRIAVGTAEKDYGSIAQQFTEVAKSLAARGGAVGVSTSLGAVPYAGGLAGGTRQDGTEVGGLTMDKDWRNPGSVADPEDSDLLSEGS